MLTANIEDGPRGPSSKLSLAGVFELGDVEKMVGPVTRV